MLFVEYFDKLKIESFETIMTLVPYHTKLLLCDFYNSSKYEQKELNFKERSFVVDYCSWLKKNIFNVKNVSDSISQTIAYAAYKEVNRCLSDLFSEKLVSFNMVDVGNMRQDLLYLEKMADDELSYLSSKCCVILKHIFCRF